MCKGAIFYSYTSLFTFLSLSSSLIFTLYRLYSLGQFILREGWRDREGGKDRERGGRGGEENERERLRLELFWYFMLTKNCLPPHPNFENKYLKIYIAHILISYMYRRNTTYFSLQYNSL